MAKSIVKEKKEYKFMKRSIKDEENKIKIFYEEIISHKDLEKILEKIKDFPDPKDETITEENLSYTEMEKEYLDHTENDNTLSKTKIEGEELFRETKKLLKIKNLSEINDFYGKIFKNKDNDVQENHIVMVQN